MRKSEPVSKAGLPEVNVHWQMELLLYFSGIVTIYISWKGWSLSTIDHRMYKSGPIEGGA